MTLPLEAVRSLLFAPGKDELKLAKALDSAADLVVADLEDAVPPAEKEAARDTIAKVFARQRGRALRFVRINAPGTEWAEADLAALAEIAPDGLMVPKATPSALTALGDEGLPVIALVETAAGVRDAYETAAHPGWPH
ncbi:aldolase/citrate lyase family protein [Prauserella oleivorans]